MRSAATEPLTSLVGRDREVAAVAGLVLDHRLVTLTGPGGSGKTRLALAAARAVEVGLPGGARWVELAAVDAPRLGLAVADALGVPAGANLPPTAALVRHLAAEAAEASGRMLLVLDNGEHVVAVLADLVDALLAGCPGLHVLVTSREALGLPGERRWPVPPLAVPEPGAPGSVAALAEVPAVRLFVDRAAAADPSFALTEHNAAAVADVCAGLDGLPLAIELAAARVATMPVDRTNVRLDRSALLLAASRRGVADRQRTLRACLDWSYHLLPAAEQAVFRRLAAFPDGFGPDEAEEACAGDGVAAEDVLPLLSRLVEKSLVELCRRDARGRYRLLETVRRYAEHRLAESGEADRVAEPAPVPAPAPEVPGTLRVYGLGAAREYCGDHLLGPADWTYQKPRELLHFLLSGQACSKEQIGLALWPDADAETLRNSFHTTLRHLRRALGRADWVVFHAGRYRLNRSLDYTSDVEQFEAGLAAARAAGDSPAAVRLLAEAVGHYRGDFLADLPGGGWIDRRRDDLRRQAETALLDLGALLQARGEPGRAAEAYRRLIAVDGLLEVAHRRLMQCYADLGERGRALRQYGELVDLLAGELGVAPAPETTMLYHRLRRAGPSAA